MLAGRAWLREVSVVFAVSAGSDERKDAADPVVSFPVAKVGPELRIGDAGAGIHGNGRV